MPSVFGAAIAEDPFSRRRNGMWLEPRAARSKKDFYTVLSSRDVLPEVERILMHDPYLMQCFRD